MKSSYCILLSALTVISSHAQVKTAEVEHYLFPEFTQGIVLMKNGKKDVKLLNYHALSEQIVFDSKGTILAVPKEQLKRIDTVFVNQRRFMIMNNKFVELLYHSHWDLYVEYKCDLKEQGKDAGFGGTSQTSAINTPSAVSMEGNLYNLELPDGYETKRYFVYWLNRNGKLKPVVNMKHLKRFYKDKDDLFDVYVKEHEVKFEDPENMLHFISHLESN